MRSGRWRMRCRKPMADELEELWKEQHEGLIKYTSWLKSLVGKGIRTVPCERCGGGVEHFWVVPGGAIVCPACHNGHGAGGFEHTVDSLFRTYAESLILLRNYHLFQLGLHVLREEVAKARQVGDDPDGDGFIKDEMADKLIQIFTQKHRSLVESRQIFLLLNGMAEAATDRGMKLPLESPEINLARMGDLLSMAGAQ